MHPVGKQEVSWPGTYLRMYMIAIALGNVAIGGGNGGFTLLTADDTSGSVIICCYAVRK